MNLPSRVGAVRLSAKRRLRRIVQRALACTPCEMLERRQLLSAGSPDPSFGTNGATLIPFQGATTDVGLGVAVDHQGRTVSVGVGRGQSVPTVLVARYTPVGMLDGTFGIGGLVTIPAGAQGYGFGVTIDSQNRIIVVGDTTLTYDNSFKTADFLVARLNVNGSMDTSFNGTGEAIIDFNGGEDEAVSAVVQPDGKIVVGGAAGLSASGPSGFGLARFNDDGTLDNTFGTSGNGKISSNISSGGSHIQSVSLDSSQNIVVTGSAVSGHNNSTIARYNPNGTLDSSFGNGGVVTIAVANNNNTATAVDFTTDGHLVITGSGENYNQSSFSYPTGYDISAIRLNSDGSLDGSFGNGGFELIDFNKSSQYAVAVRVLSSGNILIAGYDSTASIGGSSSYQSMVVRLTSTGALDTSYNGTGRAAVLTGGYDGASIASDGTVTETGIPNDTGVNFSTIRVTPAGTADNTFGTQGTVVTNFPGVVNSHAEGVALQGDGKTVVAGYTFPSDADQFTVARLKVDGSLDPTFGSGGKENIVFGGKNDQAHGVAVQTDGKIIVSGQADMGIGAAYNFNFAVARLNPDGSLDTTFGVGGKVTVDQLHGNTNVTGGTNDLGAAVAIASDGKVVLVGQSGDGSTYGAAVVRLTASGALDTSFHGTGKQFVQLNGQTTNATTVAIDSSNNVLIGGSAISAGYTKFMLVRFTAAGALDTAFGSGGSVVGSIGTFSASGEATSVAIQADGRIYAGGEISANSTEDFAVARYTSTGAPDTTFNSNGYVLTNIPSNSANSAVTVVPMNDGGVLIGGSVSPSYSLGSVALLEYDANGSLETAFGTGGVSISTTGLYSIYEVNGMALRPNGTIVVAGLGATAVGAGTNTYVGQFQGGNPPAAQVITGNVYWDTNGNGTQDAGETGLAGSTIFIDNNNSGVLSSGDPSAVTTATGSFTFSNLPPGQYIVREQLPAGYYSTNASGAAFTVNLTYSSTPVLNVGAAIYSSINGEVYNDFLGKGFSTGNAGLPGVSVYLDLKGDGTLDAGDPVAVSDVNGNYTLSNLPAGTFALREVLPAGYIITQPQYVGQMGFYSVSLGALLPTAKPFGDFKLASVQGNFNTAAATGTGIVAVGTAVTVSLNSPSGSITTQTVTTDSSGNYRLGNLGPGTATVTPSVPAGYTVTPVSASAISTSAATISLNFTALAGGVISGTVFSDDNANGVQDAGEVSLSGVPIFLDVLASPGGTPVQTLTTVTGPGNGNYLFGNLSPGIYVVREQLPSAYAREVVPSSGSYTFFSFNGGTSSGNNFADLPYVPNRQLSGTVIGTSGSFNNDGNTIAKAFDGNFATFFDAPTASGSWAGLDLGTSKIITQVSYASRSGFASRMNGGIFQGSNSAAFSSGVANLYLIGANANASSTALTNSPVNVATAYRYVRYVGPANSLCNVSELEFFGISPVSTTVTAVNFNANASTQSLTFAFSSSLSADPGIGAVDLENITASTSTKVSAASLAETYNASNNTMTVTFPGFTGAKLLAGIYQATLIAADVTDANGQHPAGNTVYSFLWDAAGSRLTIPAGRGTVSVKQVSIQSGGALDLANNNLIITGAGSGGYASILQMLLNGYQNGTWQGTSGILSTTAASDGKHLTSLGLALSTGQTFEQLPTQIGDVLLKYTYYGDANLDGKVDGSDYSLIDNGYLNHLTGWANGDLNYDGVVNGSDYTLMDNAFNTQGAVVTAQVATHIALGQREFGSITIADAAIGDDQKKRIKSFLAQYQLPPQLQ